MCQHGVHKPKQLHDTLVLAQILVALQACLASASKHCPRWKCAAATGKRPLNEVLRAAAGCCKCSGPQDSHAPTIGIAGWQVERSTCLEQEHVLSAV